MTTVQVKQRDGKKWFALEISELAGNSIISQMISASKDMIAMLDVDGQKLFVSNSPEQVAKYKDKGVSMSANDLKLLMGSEVFPPVLCKAFGDGATLEVFKGDSNEGKDNSDFSSSNQLGGNWLKHNQ